MEIRKLGERGQIVIPEAIRSSAGLRKGEKLIFEVSDGKITMQKAEAVWKALKRVPSEPPIMKEFLEEKKKFAKLEKAKWN